MTKLNEIQGRENRRRGDAWEDEIARSFLCYAEKQYAYVDFMPLPTKPCMVGGRLYRVCDGAAPFDVYGYRPQSVISLDAQGHTTRPHFAVAVGAEIKSTKHPETSLRIVKATSHGGGLQQHQLYALADLIAAGGIGYVIWNNGGQVGTLTGPAILNARQVFDDSLATEDAGRSSSVTPGARSLSWKLFTVIEPALWRGGQPIYHWLVEEEAA